TRRIKDDGAERLSLRHRLVQQKTAGFCARREAGNRRQAGSDLLDRSAQVSRLSPAGSRESHFGTGQIRPSAFVPLIAHNSHLSAVMSEMAIYHQLTGFCVCFAANVLARRKA